MRHCASLALVFLVACGSNESDVRSEELVGSAEGIEYAPIGLDGSTRFPVDAQLSAEANVNLREAASADSRLIMVIPQGATVAVTERTTPENGYYRVTYFGRTGWAYGAHMALSVGSLSAALTDAQRDNIMGRAQQAVGYSYWWGHGRFGCDLAKGDCNPNAGSTGCPDCSHSGAAGADCSGMVAKAWAVPASAPGICVDGHPYSSTYFATTELHWNNIAESNIMRADAYVLIGGGHIMIKATGWAADGRPDIIECAGCNSGCIHHYRGVSGYKALRRHENL